MIVGEDGSNTKFNCLDQSGSTLYIGGETAGTAIMGSTEPSAFMALHEYVGNTFTTQVKYARAGGTIQSVRACAYFSSSYLSVVTWNPLLFGFV